MIILKKGVGQEICRIRGGGKGNKKGEYEKGGKKGIKREKEDDKL